MMEKKIRSAVCHGEVDERVVGMKYNLIIIETIGMKPRSHPSLYVGYTMILVCHAEDDSSEGSKKHLVVNF